MKFTEDDIKALERAYMLCPDTDAGKKVKETIRRMLADSVEAI